MKTAGLAGCKIGWMLISFDEEEPLYDVIRNADEMTSVFNKYDRIFIDLPIGLEDENKLRECDILMKKALGKEYDDGMILPPIRAVLEAPSYVEANAITFDYTEEPLAPETWGIVTKIKLVDNILKDNKELRDKVFESHPEYLFQKMNRGIIFQKKNLKRGVRHRLELTIAEEEIAADFFRNIKEEYRKNDVAEDKIVDAMALALYAKKSIGKDLKTMPENPQTDSEGLVKAYYYI